MNRDSSIVTLTGYKHTHCTTGIRIPERVGTLFSLLSPTTQPALQRVSESFGAKRQPVTFMQCRRKARAEHVSVRQVHRIAFITENIQNSVLLKDQC